MLMSVEQYYEYCESLKGISAICAEMMDELVFGDGIDCKKHSSSFEKFKFKREKH